jgi:hypothetical protein
MMPPHRVDTPLFPSSPYVMSSAGWSVVPGSATFPPLAYQDSVHGSAQGMAPGSATFPPVPYPPLSYHDHNLGLAHGMAAGYTANPYGMNAGNQHSQPQPAGPSTTSAPVNDRNFTRSHTSTIVRDIRKSKQSALVADPKNTNPLPPSAFQYYCKRTSDGKPLLPRYTIQPPGNYTGILVMTGVSHSHNYRTMISL